MNTVLTIVGVLITLIVIFAIYRYLRVSYQSKKLNEKRFERVRALYEKIGSGQPMGMNEVLPYVENATTRQLTYDLLVNSGKKDLFPQEYYTLLKSAESQLVNWLEFPTELDACPDQIEHIKRVTIDFDGKGNLVHYEVFRYRVHEPHWAAESGWILGVVGPYFNNSEPYAHARATFSRVSSTIEKISPEEEAQWVHDNIAMRR